VVVAAAYTKFAETACWSYSMKLW